MGKLIYSMNVSLDGFIETTDHSLGRANVEEELHRWFNDQARTLDATLHGRRMYQLMADYGPTGEDDPSATDAMREFARIWKPMPKIVISSSLERVESAGCPPVREGAMHAAIELDACSGYTWPRIGHAPGAQGLGGPARCRDLS